MQFPGMYLDSQYTAIQFSRLCFKMIESVAHRQNGANSPHQTSGYSLVYSYKNSQKGLFPSSTTRA